MNDLHDPETMDPPGRDPVVMENRPSVLRPRRRPASSADVNGAGTQHQLIELLTGGVHRRVMILAAVSCAAFSLGAVLGIAMPWILGTPESCHLLVYLSLTLVVLNLSLGVVAWSRRLGETALMRLTMVHVLGCAALMSASEMAMQSLFPQTLKGLSGICLWILLIPQVLPLTVRGSAAITCAAAATLPVAYVSARMAGMPPLATATLFDWFIPPLFCAALGTAASFSLARYAAALGEARRQVRELGRYDLLSQIGAGGMGEVWRARHRLLPRDAAIKFVRESRSDGKTESDPADLTQWFDREAHAIALLESPHTVRIFDYGVSDNGELFYVMELLHGYDLETLVLQHGRLAPGRVAQLLAQACMSLSEAHAKGLLHRDIKPSNLMLCQLGTQSDFVKVLDFGMVAAMRGAAGFGPQGAGDEDRLVGTPGYIAPEAMIPGQGVDQRADLYSLGCVAYWLLTGTRVFPDVDGGAEMLRHLTGEVDAPSARSGEPLPADLEAIILGCLRKNPEQRPASALAVRELLKACACWRLWTEDDARQWWLTHQPVVAAASASASSRPAAECPK